MNIDVLYETIIDALLNAVIEIHGCTHYEIYGNPNGIHRWDIYTYLNRISIYDFNNHQTDLNKYVE